MNSPLWNRTEAARYLRMHPASLGKLALTGKVRSIQHTPGGRRWYTQQMCDEYIAAREAEQAALDEARAAAEAAAPIVPGSPWQKQYVA